MASTVNQAFSEFLANTVNLDSGITRLGRASLNWLVGQLKSFPDKSSRVSQALFRDGYSIRVVCS